MALEDYIILPIVIPTRDSSVTHTLYLRQNRPKFPVEDDGCTLFVANVPVDSTLAHFKALFATLGGRTESVRFQSIQDTGKYVDPEDVPMALDDIQDEEFSKEVKRLKRASVLPKTWTRTVLPSGSNAYVKFVEAAELKVVLKAASRKPRLVWGENIPANRTPAPLGIERYRQHLALSTPDPEALQESVDAYMELFNKEEILRKRNQKLQRSEPDEEGFVTITRGGRSGAGRVADAEKIRKTQEGRGIVSDLYRFQRRDERKAKMDSLRVKFEEDKRKIQELRSRRRFLG